MAERRMFSKTVVESDMFLDMPTSARCLYFHLGMQADDDGFISSPKAIIRSSNCSEDDLKLLIAKGFVISFESGIIVIRHWKTHNYIQKDRYKPTTFKKECRQLVLENNVYQECIQSVSNMDTTCIQTVSEMDTQDRLSKVSIGKERVRETYCAELDKPDTTPAVIYLILNDRSQYPIYQADINKWQELYPAVNILQQLRAMSGWLDSNPTKRKTKNGIKRFINSWLTREQDKGGYKGYEPDGRTDTENSISAKLY